MGLAPYGEPRYADLIRDKLIIVAEDAHRRAGGAERIDNENDGDQERKDVVGEPGGKVHVFYSRWKNEAGFDGWLTCCEIAHAVGDSPEGPFETIDVAIAPRGGDWWDGGSCHNPTIHQVGDQYVLFYLGVFDGTVYTKRVGMAVSDSLYGPWKRTDEPIIQPDPDPAADRCCHRHCRRQSTPQPTWNGIHGLCSSPNDALGGWVVPADGFDPTKPERIDRVKRSAKGVA